MKLQIITPEYAALEAEVDMVTVVTTTGEVGFMKDHAPFIAALVPHVTRYKVGNNEEKMCVSGGVVEVLNNTVTILAPASECVNDIDFERATEAKERAMQRLKQRENVDMARARAALARANARLSMRP